MRKNILLTSVLLAGATLPPDSRSAQFDAVDRDFTEGVRYYEAADYGAAMDRFTHALLLSPSNLEIQNYIASTQRALTESAPDRPLDPRELQSIVKRAQGVLQLRRLKAAETLSELKIAYDESRLQTAQALLETCRGIDIVVDVTLGDDSESLLIKHYVKSICAGLQKNFDKNPNFIAAQIRKIQGYLAFCRSDWPEAVLHWTQALLSDPKDKHLRKLLERAKIHVERSNRDSAVARLMSEGEEAYAAKQFEKAEKLFEGALNLNPYNPTALALLKDSRRGAQDMLLAPIPGWKKLAARNQANGDLLAAARYWLDILEIDPTDESARRSLDRNSSALMKEVQSTAAASSPGKNARSAKSADEAKRLYVLGLIFYSQSRLSEARESLFKAARLNPGDDYARNALQRVESEMKIPK